MLAERLSPGAICQVIKSKAHQLYSYMDELYEEVSSEAACLIKDMADITFVKVESELDELRSFVGWKAHKQGLWLALDRAGRRQVVALLVGERSVDGGLGLWQASPEHYGQKATFYTDDGRAYKHLIRADQHRFSQEKKGTNQAERFFCARRQRCSRWVRLSLSFWKKLDRHIKSIRFVVTNDTLSLQN